MSLTVQEFGRLSVVLVRTRNPLNIGAAARAMANFGFSSLRLVQPYDVAFREARSAVGADELMANAEQKETVAEAISDCEMVVGTTALRNRELRHSLNDLSLGGRLIRRRLKTGRVALLFGSEKRGLSNEDLSHCDWLMRIPTKHGSMNLGQAVAVCLYELSRASNQRVRPEKVARASSADLERITQMLLESLQISGTRAELMQSTEVNLRRLTRHMSLDEDDAKAWLGIFRQLLWKLKSRE